ncbi:tRNA (adenosine(37)-N6)-threonylcarbamoyltransferase complex transferase subunit TsaD [Desulfobotulus sp. H1]|uniref:tRNA N6-adenosine threonylcarbamoyltransferase n=1 Tax=Desulfobotulus pelophilus TaxID=2823377 RepID=A0ABT3N840_9BACT|nr:tRNA (adenosine(37)-N6)-threonylcarbamoyltransferase complex transferase subunit TsaD [Desulfobotulus pelophilus]MCW7753624.1 tRNA (adenosine(37)-N6)-threonylcarbamoyltransferase complex transferase subunit TsaD [Desulfobotulus pelophilus]
MRVLGIESSCDETAAAVVEDGVRIVCSEVASQVDIHHRYGGVVPELASRHHVEAICPVVEAVLGGCGMAPSDVDAVAVTQGPGLVGALLVGFGFARAFAFGLGIPCVGVNHLLGHVHSVFLDPERDPPAYPFVALTVSGGHTALYHVVDSLTMILLGQTRDDAAGEAYDKVAKMMGLGYPGGAVLDAMAVQGKTGGLVFPRALLDGDSLDFSFSGLKSAVARFLSEDEGATSCMDIAASFQEAVVDVLVAKAFLAVEIAGCSDLAIVGGVAANRGLQRRAAQMASDRGIRLHIPPVSLCGDNAAMIAAAGFHYLKAGKTLALDADVFSRATDPGRRVMVHR